MNYTHEMLTIHDDLYPASPLRQGIIAKVRCDEHTLDHEFDVLALVF